MNVPSWVCIAHLPTCRKNSTRNGEIMNPIIYAIGFTLGFCLCLFMGYSPDTPYYQQALMMFAGFCFGGVALCVIENLDD